jgi:hypothetical protein
VSGVVPSRTSASSSPWSWLRKIGRSGGADVLISLIISLVI